MTNNRKNKIELLSPAGGMDSLKAAIHNGCDAVYIGGKDFSARKHAENFDAYELERAIDYAHLRQVKVYVAINTLYKDSEMPSLARFCAQTYRAGADAFIVQDIGAAGFVREEFDIDIHASTQLNVKTAADAAFLKKYGFKRLILSRETSLDEIKRITSLGVETEVFAHGALCYSHSGQCLMSAFIGRRSGNRGDCAQPCRLSYELIEGGKKITEGHLLSPKDMLTLDLLPEMIDAGVTALKIEGRMKSPQYVALITKAYREGIDGSLPTDTIRSEIAQVFSRGGEFCSGYFKTHSSREIMSTSPKSSGVVIGEVVKYISQMNACVISLRGELVGGDGIYIGDQLGAYYNSATPAGAGDIVTVGIPKRSAYAPVPGDKVYKSYDKQLDDRLKALATSETRKLTLIGCVEAKSDQRLRFTLKYMNIVVTEYGAVVEHAAKKPISRERLLRQLSKTGGTPFLIEFAECEVEERIYLDIKDINDVRRRAAAEMERRIIRRYKREYTDIHNDVFTNDEQDDLVLEVSEISHTYTVLVNDAEQALVAMEYAPYRVYLECTPDNLDNLEQIAKSAGGRIQIFVALSPCLPPGEEHLLARLEESAIEGYLVRTYGHLQKLSALNSKKEIALDYSFNVMNARSFAQLSEYASSICLSPETNTEGRFPCVEARSTRESSPCARETIIYGRLTLMTTNLCPIGIFDEKGSGRYCRLCGKAGVYTLVGNHNRSFPIFRDCDSCTARILSPTKEGLPVDDKAYHRLDFTTETPDECRAILHKYM